MGIDPDTMDVHFINGVVKISENVANIEAEVAAINTRAPIAANGGEGPPLGRFVEVIAGHPIDAFVSTSVYLVLKNSLSAASWPTFSETRLLPHCFSK